MPTQTKFVCPSGGVNVDLSGIFEDLGGGTSYGTATKFKVGTTDFTGLFHASTSSEDRPSFNTGFKVNGTDLSTLFRRRGFVGINITTQPTTQIINNNASATFSIAATAAGTPAYQWYKNNSIISGATSTTYTTGALTTANDTDTYFCRVSYSGSSVDSNSVTTRIKPYVVSTATVPSPLLLDTGAFPVAVQCYANGSGTIKYSWFLNGIALTAQQEQSANLTNPSGHQYVFTLNASTKGNYTCKVTSNFDSVGSLSSALTAAIIPPIVTISTSQYIYNNTNSVGFSSSLSQGTAVTYKWYKDGNEINGATGSSYSFNMSSSTYGTYNARATNDGGFDDSNFITVYMNPLITVNPSSQTVDAGSTASFSVTAVGSPTLSYQWYKNGSSIFGAIGSSYTTPTLTSSDNGNQYYCIVSCSVSGTSTATSGAATLTVEFAPTIGSVSFNGTTVTYGEQPFSISNGQSFTITASNVNDGQPNATGGWYKWDGGNYGIFLSSSFSYTLSQDDDSTEYYRFILTNSKGTAQSYDFSVTTG